MGLKEATHDKHKQAERMPFNVRMFKGELSEKEYLHYLLQQLYLFKELESSELPHPALNRVEKVNQDIDELVQKVDILELPALESTAKYLKYLSELSSDNKLPHIYLHYLALMFGGQMMKEKVPSAGKMYDFEDMREAAQSIREVQQDDWADEVNVGFDFMIEIFDELERIHNPA